MEENTEGNSKGQRRIETNLEVADELKGFSPKDVEAVNPNIERGKKARRSGLKFEQKVRHDLEDKGFFVTKCGNNVDLDSNEIIQAKRMFNPYSRALTLGTGFPDFVAWRRNADMTWKIIGVESKKRKFLTKEEKAKILVYKEKKTFDEILIAYESPQGVSYAFA